MCYKTKSIQFDGLGTRWQCEIFDDIDDNKLESIKVLLTDELNRFTHNYSRFDEKSLIGSLNCWSEIINPPTEMVEMFKFARDMYDVSEGVFNISVGGKLHNLGYGKTGMSAPIMLDFWNEVVIDNERIVIPKGLVVDLGGFGKGWLIDNFAEILRKNKVNWFIINGGGDLLVRSDRPIEIALEHPFDSSKKIGQTRITSGALAASSTLKRVWEYNGNNYNHIIDPLSGESSDGSVIGTFVRANSALLADTMATTLLIKPELDNILKEKFNLKTILLDKSQFRN